MRRRNGIATTAAALLLVACGPGGIEEQTKSAETSDTEKGRVVHVYSHRHYDTDRALFEDFTERTGIEVRVVTADADELMARLAKEGQRSPCDLFITADAGRLELARQRGLLRSVKDSALEAAIPQRFRDPQGHWFGLTMRARVFAYHKDRVDPADIRTYADIIRPQWRGRVLVRSSENVYNQSLMAAMVAHLGEQKALAWAMGVVQNMARTPKGGDTDQLLALAEGQGDVAIVNTYYVAKLLQSTEPAKLKAAESIGMVFPDLYGHGTHVNVSGAGLARHAPNAQDALELLRFLSSRNAQERFAEGNQEYPVSPDVAIPSSLMPWGVPIADTLNMAELGRRNAEAVKLLDLAGWR